MQKNLRETKRVISLFGGGEELLGSKTRKGEFWGSSKKEGKVVLHGWFRSDEYGFLLSRIRNKKEGSWGIIEERRKCRSSWVGLG